VRGQSEGSSGLEDGDSILRDGVGVAQGIVTSVRPGASPIDVDQEVLDEERRLSGRLADDRVLDVDDKIVDQIVIAKRDERKEKKAEKKKLKKEKKEKRDKRREGSRSSREGSRSYSSRERPTITLPDNSPKPTTSSLPTTSSIPLEAPGSPLLESLRSRSAPSTPQDTHKIPSATDRLREIVRLAPKWVLLLCRKKLILIGILREFHRNCMYF